MAENSGLPILDKALDEANFYLKQSLPPWNEASGLQRLIIFFFKLAIILPVLILIGIIIAGYSLYIIFYVYPLVSSTSDSPDLYFWHSNSEKFTAELRGWVCFGLSSWNLFWLCISVYRAMMTSPGEVPNTSTWEITSINKEVSESTPLTTENRKDGGIRICVHCNLKKPDRCHHCKQCGKCCLKMDHHCNWIANCVGYYNYKYFYLTIFYGASAMAIFIATFWESVVVALYDKETSNSMSFIIVLTYSLMTMLGVTIIAFCIFHTWMIANNYTSIEFCEKRRFKVPGYEKSPYSISTIENFKEALGQNPLLWYFPFESRGKEDKGLYFKSKKY
ncbi:unnamed protein product [Blepharisma stoltei]|uniref:Palmitoyltransferase n=1 Tax=Blepharisma stoltei TaxID=1481888 RepID=A0AAU9J5I7_9CILI|nr:unnamed protein product [Blepharisma stoltei]